MEPQNTIIEPTKSNSKKYLIVILLLILIAIPAAIIFGFSKGKQKLELVGGTKEKIVKVEVPVKEEKSVVQNVKEIITDEQSVKQYSIFVKKEGLGLYNQDSEKGKVLAELAYNEELQVISISKKTGWYHVKRINNSATGWITNDSSATSINKVYIFGNPAVGLSDVKIKAIYFVPEGSDAENDWHRKLESSLNELKSFMSREFGGQINVEFEIYPTLVGGKKNCGGYFNFPGSSCSSLGANQDKIWISDELKSSFFSTGGKYYNQEFMKENEKDFTLYGIFGYSPSAQGSSLSQTIDNNKFQYVGGGGNTQGGITSVFLHMLKLPAENVIGNTQPGPGVRFCSQMKNGVKVDYPDIVASFGSYDKAKSYIDDDIKAGMGYDWSKK